MNAMQIFSSPSIQAIGWTLLHSLWQGLIVVIVSLLVMRCMPMKWSGARYLVATGSLLVIFMSSVATFIYLNDSVNHVSPQLVTFAHHTYPIQAQQAESHYVTELLLTFKATIQYYLPLIVICWGIGTMFFSIRLFGGWLTVRRLKASGIPVEGEWNEKLQYLAGKIGVTQLVHLAESAMAQAPMVIGYFKPVVLLPLGMLGGLSTAQLESIIIHELIHIRRRDYLVNLLQSILEAVFFFNPFVWIVSGIIRREREHCCDDTVIALHGNPLAYAHALTALEEARLSRTGFALSFAENKNQLLNRIKRIMEKSVKPYSLQERIVPAILLITGLMCASWLTVQSGKQKEDSPVVSQDTTIRIEKSGSYYRKTITTIDEDGKPHEQVVEEYNGDEDMQALLEPMDFDFAIPSIEAIEAISAIPPIPDFNFDFHLQIDTIPQMFGPGSHGNWDDLGREFEFDLYARNGEEINAMIKELQSRLESQARNLENLDLHALNKELAEIDQEEFLAQHDQQLKKLEENMEQWNQENEKNLEQLDAQLKQMDCNTYFQRLNAYMDSAMMHIPHFRASEKMVSYGTRYTSLQKELREELIKDGYFEKDEKINSIEIGDRMYYININGKQIKKKDMPKYKSIFDKHAIGRLDRDNFPPGRKE